MDRLVHEDPRPVGTDLTLGVEVRQQRTRHGIVEVCVLEDDHRRLATEFECHVLEGRSGSRHDRLAGPDLTGE
jgi:hypothetical protein